MISARKWLPVVAIGGLVACGGPAGSDAQGELSSAASISNPNLLVSPDSIGDEAWRVQGPDIQVALGYGVAPDGTTHASRVTVIPADWHLLAQDAAVTPGNVYTFSFYAKNNGGADAAYCVHDLTHGVDIVESTSYVSELSASTWTRVHVTFTAPPGCTAVTVYPERDAAGAVDVLLWGAKLEVGPEPTGGVDLPGDTAGVTATLAKTAAWAGGYCAIVTVKNVSTQPVTWRVTLPVEGTIYTSWNANLAPNGAQVTFTGVDWNRTLAPGQIAQPGFCANVPRPAGPTSDTPGVTATLTRTAFWGSGYCATVTVRNVSGQPVTWRVTLPVTGAIYTSWNANLTRNGGQVSFTGLPWNATLAPNQSAEPGFCANL